MSDEQQSQTTTPIVSTTGTIACPHQDAAGKRWGDDPKIVLTSKRRQELLKLHADQVRWLGEAGRDCDLSQSPFAQATRQQGDSLANAKPEAPLTGAEVYFLAWTSGGLFPLAAENLHLEGANLRAAHLEGAVLYGAHLESTILAQACMRDAGLGGVHLEGAALYEAHLEGAKLTRACLGGATLGSAFFSSATTLDNAVVDDPMFGMPLMADVRWQGINLAATNWPDQPMLGDERAARELEKQPLQKWGLSGGPLPKDATRGQRRKAESTRRDGLEYDWRRAARAYRQLASVMRDQGMSDEADRFAYRGNVCQRELYRVQGKHLRRFGSWLLDLTSGYGYKPLRSVAAYVLIISLFAGLYLLNAQFAAPHLSWDEALVLSVSSFHGRGFFSSGISLGDTLARLAAAEAIVGLLIEITFIATFTQRFFAR